MGQVSEDDRLLLGLKELQGLSLKELREVYGVSENVLKVILVSSPETCAEGLMTD